MGATVAPMPNIRTLNKVVQVPLLATFSDPVTGYLIEITTSLAGVPTSCRVGLVQLPMTFSDPAAKQWRFVGWRTSTDLWQIDMYETGANLRGTAITRA